MAQYCLEVSYSGASYFAKELKTIVALSALAVARFALLEEPWPDKAEEVTGVTNYQILDCSREMFEVVSREQADVLASVNIKYSTADVRIRLLFCFSINFFLVALRFKDFSPLLSSFLRSHRETEEI